MQAYSSLRASVRLPISYPLTHTEASDCPDCPKSSVTPDFLRQILLQMRVAAAISLGHLVLSNNKAPKSWGGRGRCLSMRPARAHRKSLPLSPSSSREYYKPVGQQGGSAGKAWGWDYPRAHVVERVDWLPCPLTSTAALGLMCTCSRAWHSCKINEGFQIKIKTLNQDCSIISHTPSLIIFVLFYFTYIYLFAYFGLLREHLTMQPQLS